MFGFKTPARKAALAAVEAEHSAALDELDAIEASHGVDSPEWAAADARVMELAQKLPAPPLASLGLVVALALYAADRIRGIRYDLPSNAA
jgi:2-keto-3-deoxy-L-rhamnonate aldolase RhmA